MTYADHAAFAPTRRCDFCRGRLGLVMHRYYRMRFCCAAHLHAYRQRLTEDTRAKIRHLATRAGADESTRAAADGCGLPTVIPRPPSGPHQSIALPGAMD